MRYEPIENTKVTLKKRCLVAANSAILPKVSDIGKNSINAAGSVVTKTIQANVITGGNLAKNNKRTRFSQKYIT